LAAAIRFVFRISYFVVRASSIVYSLWSILAAPCYRRKSFVGFEAQLEDCFHRGQQIAGFKQQVSKEFFPLEKIFIFVDSVTTRTKSEAKKFAAEKSEFGLYT